jgi:dUTP pyrophosphatase
MKVKIKKLHPDAVIPAYAKNGDAGMDLTAVRKYQDEDGNICYETGLAFEIPKGFVGMLFPRSSNAKKDMLLSNCVGIIDSGFRGNVTLKFKLLNYYLDETGHFDRYDNSSDPETYYKGDRIGQIIILPYPEIEFEETDELSHTDRGTGGYGSSGK